MTINDPSCETRLRRFSQVRIGRNLQRMPVIESAIDTRSDTFAANRADMLRLLADVRALEGKVLAAGESKRDLFTKRGQILPRERVALLLDRGAPWLEISTLAGHKMHDEDGGGGIIGIGYVSGIRCMVIASDSAVKGGISTPMSVHKNRAGAGDRARSGQAAGRAACRVRRREPPVPVGNVRRRAVAASPIRRACRPPASRRSPSCTAPRRRAAPIMPGLSATTTSSSAASRRCSWPGHRSCARRRARSPRTRSSAARTCMSPRSGLGEYLAEDDADGIRHRARSHGACCPGTTSLPYQAPRTFAEPLLRCGRTRRPHADRLPQARSMFAK